MPTNSSTSLNTPYIVLTGVVLVAVVFLFMVMRPMMDEANTLKQSIAEDTQTLNNKQTFLNSLGEKIRQLASLPEVEKQMATVLPEADRVQDIIRVLHEYATQSGITVNSVINTSSAREAQTNADRARGDALSIPAGLRTLEFEVNSVGSYEQVRLFLKLIENSPRIVDVKEVAMVQASGQPGQVTSKMVMNLYSQQAPQTTGL